MWSVLTIITSILAATLVASLPHSPEMVSSTPSASKNTILPLHPARPKWAPGLDSTGVVTDGNDSASGTVARDTSFTAPETDPVTKNPAYDWQDTFNTTGFPQKRAVIIGWAGMYECSKRNFKGECRWTRTCEAAACNRCDNFTWGTSTDGSLGPDQGLTCTVYEEKDCKGHKGEGFTFPGSMNKGSNWFLNTAHGILPVSYSCKWQNPPVE